MKTSREPPLPPERLLAEPNTFIARLILAELLAKRGFSPLERKRLRYMRSRRR